MNRVCYICAFPCGTRIREAHEVLLFMPAFIATSVDHARWTVACSSLMEMENELWDLARTGAAFVLYRLVYPWVTYNDCRWHAKNGLFFRQEVPWPRQCVQCNHRVGGTARTCNEASSSSSDLTSTWWPSIPYDCLKHDMRSLGTMTLEELQHAAEVACIAWTALSMRVPIVDLRLIIVQYVSAECGARQPPATPTATAILESAEEQQRLQRQQARATVVSLVPTWAEVKVRRKTKKKPPRA